MKIPFVDLFSQYKEIKEEIDKSIFRVIENTSFIGGEEVSNFEKDFAIHIGVSHVISCANGTDSIEILLKAMGIGVGDEVIVPAISWISTSEAVSAVGATPIFVDIDPIYYTIDETLIEAKINENTQAIIPVHLYGQPANMPYIMKLARKYKLLVIEDCAQAHDAVIGGKKVGTWGDAASFSFYPGKNLGAYGDAGCMVTDNSDIALKCKMLANHGQTKKNDHVLEGRNSRLDGLQAAILGTKLPHLDSWTKSRIDLANYYNILFEGKNVITPSVRPDSQHVFHLYVIRVENREELSEHLNNNGVQTAIHYPNALPFLKAYQKFNHQAKDFPVAFKYQNEILSLPIYPELPLEAIQYIVKLV